MPPEIIYFLIVISALGGLVISFYIRSAKKTGKSLICPTESDCNMVVNSAYSRLFGVPNEELGIVYYSVTALAYIVFLFWGFKNDYLYLILGTITGIAFLISVYLTYVQGVRLKEWCAWCVLSAIFSTIIFAGALTLIFS